MTVIIQYAQRLLHQEGRMGNSQSEFEQEFYKRYSYIQQLEDPMFGLIKVYRKSTVKYDYIMIMELSLHGLHASHVSILQDRLRQLRTHQNETTLRVYHYKIAPQNRVECKENRMLIFAEYINRTLADYLCALRSSPNFVLTVQEVIYVLKHVAKGCLVLQRMSIVDLDLSSSKIFLSPDGEVLLCPLVYIIDSLNATYSSEQVFSIRDSYEKYSVSNLHKSVDPFNLRPQFHQLFLEMTAHLPPQALPLTNSIYWAIRNSGNLESLYAELPETETETVQIEQMHRYDNMTGEFYSMEE